MNGLGKNKILPIYISFNDSSTFKFDFEKNSHSSLNVRVIYSFLAYLWDEQHNRLIFSNEFLKDFDMFYMQIYRKLANFQTCNLLSFLRELTNRDILLLVDEIGKISNNLLKEEVIKLCGDLTDKPGIYVLLSSLDNTTVEGPTRTRSNRNISYINFEPLQDLIGLLQTHSKYIKLRNLTNIQLALYEASVLPKVLKKILYELLELSKDELINLNKNNFIDFYDNTFLKNIDILDIAKEFKRTPRWNINFSEAINFSLKNLNSTNYSYK